MKGFSHLCLMWMMYHDHMQGIMVVDTAHSPVGSGFAANLNGFHITGSLGQTIQNSTEAELIGIYQALSVAQQSGIQKLHVICDCQSAIDQLKRSKFPNSLKHKDLLIKIKLVLIHFKGVTFEWKSRSYTQEVDRLAKRHAGRSRGQIQIKSRTHKFWEPMLKSKLNRKELPFNQKKEVTK